MSYVTAWVRRHFIAAAALVALLYVGSVARWAPSVEESWAPVAFAQPSATSIALTAPYRVTVGVAAAQLTASGNVHGIVLKAVCPGQTIYVGTSAAVTTATGYPMVDGETLTLEIRNANQLFAIASAAAQSVAVLPFSRH
jgi:hypothetical protein